MWSADWIAFVWSSLPGAVLATCAALGLVSDSTALLFFAISFVGLNLMHMGATWERVYVQNRWRGFPVERVAIPLSLATFAVVFESVGGGALLLALQYFLSFHHALMQNYGIVRQAERRSGRSVDFRLDMAACLLLPAAALLYRPVAVSNVYSGAVVPTFPLPLVQLVAAAGLVALIAFVWRELRDPRATAAGAPIGIGMFAGTNVLWAWMLVTLPHPAMPLYALASGHYVQYLYFVWRASPREGATAGSASLFAWLRTWPRSRWRFLVMMLALGGGVTLLLTFASVGLRAAAVSAGWRPLTALDIPPWAAAMIGINLEHYWLDHRIWRSPRPARTVVVAA